MSGSRAAATVTDDGTGLAVTFFLEAETGQLIATSYPAPNGHNAIAGPGEFLIGSQGYGEFSTAHHDATGAVTRRWPSHAQVLIDNRGVISGPESQNASWPPNHFVRFDAAGGAVHQGPTFSEYDPTYPALDRDGTAVFSCDGALRAVDADLTMRELLTADQGGRAGSSRVLLLEDGHVAYASHDELVIHRESGLGPLNDGVWPCGDGGLRGNPVKFYPPS